MSRLKRDMHRGCLIKKTFKDRKIAKNWVKLMRRRHGYNLKIYRCRFCGKFHTATREAYGPDDARGGAEAT